MNLKLYKFIGVLCLIPIWVFRGNLSFFEIILAVSIFFVLPVLFHIFLINKINEISKINNFLFSIYLSFLFVHSLDLNLGIMGLIPYLEKLKSQFGYELVGSNLDILIFFLILILLIFLVIFYLQLNGLKILTVFTITILLFNILDFRKNISMFPEIVVKEYDNTLDLPSKKKLIIVFDEMSGVNSLETNHPSGLYFKKNVINLFKKYEFTYYPNALSVSAASDISIPTMLNFIKKKEKINTYESLRVKGKNPLVKKSKNYFIENEILQNRFFDLEENKNIVVYQSLYLNFCNHPKVIRCNQYNPFDRKYQFIKGFNNNSISRILSAYTNSLSAIGKFLLRIGIQFDIADSYLDPIGQKASFPYMLNNIIIDLENEKSNLFFAHYLVPHTPYLWDQKCNFNGSQESKGNFFNFHLKNIDDKIVQHNLERNCLIFYLDGFLNKLSQKAYWNNLEIFFISDHGARLLSDNENFKSIIFAYKKKNSYPGSNNESIISNFLFEKLNN